MISKGFPPYRIEGEGIDSYIVDANGADAVVLISLSSHYCGVFEETNLMQILCDALNNQTDGNDQ